MTGRIVGPSEADVAAAEDPRIGSTLAGRYRILASLGEGGMGMVYRGVHEALRKPVAIKFLQQKINSNREMVARFEREAVTAANLRHPNIAEAIDYGSLPDGTLYLVMELVEGLPLRKLIVPGQGLPVDRALRILEQIATALDLAHSMGIVHRDLKPENILIFDRGSEHDIVKIIDFGIARITSEMFKSGPTALTAAGSVFGTPQYMAPEQVMGQPVDGRADQYAIGVITFEMLTGSQPFTAANYGDLVMQHVGAPPPRVIERAPHVPAAIDAVVDRMMAKLPDERFTTVTEAFRAMRGDAAPNSLPANSFNKSSSTILMQSPNTTATSGLNTGEIAYAATIAPGEVFSLPNITAPVAIVTPPAAAPAAISTSIPTPAATSAPSPAVSAISLPSISASAISASSPSLPAISTPAPEPAKPTSTNSVVQPPAATNSTQTSAKSPIPKIALIVPPILVVGGIIAFLVLRSPDSPQDPRPSAGDATVREDSPSGGSRPAVNTTKTTSPTSTAKAPATLPTSTTNKYRLLLKDGKYPFCVTSKLKQAYPVRTNDEGLKMCVGTPDGSIPSDSLKPYNPSEFQWD